MTVRDLELAVMFLRRVVARGEDEDILLRTVLRLEAEIARRRSDRRR